MLASSIQDLIPISAAMLSPTAMLGIDVYICTDASAKPVLFLAGSETPDIERLARLAEEGAGKLYIDCENQQRYQRYLRDNWQDLVTDDSQSFVDRMALMGEVVRDVLRDEFAGRDTDQIVNAAKEMGSATCDLLGNAQVTARDLCRVLHHDYGTFTHSTNVSFYCVLLARELGFSGEELKQIATGGLLHDLGKLYIDERVLNKPGRLDDFEFREIKRHPLAGFRELVVRDDLSFGQVMMVYQHHERINGTGYPVGCGGEELHQWSQICAVVDVYEALTSNRPYRRPASHKVAMAILAKGNREEFNPEVLKCWTQLVNRKP